MTIDNYVILQNRKLTEKTFEITIDAPELANKSGPGQFCNIKVSDGLIPLLRRPFSISDVSANEVTFMISITGTGTNILAEKKVGEQINVLGPLGNGFKAEDDFDTALIAGGGIGIAPFPFLIKSLSKKGKEIIVLNGARTAGEIIKLNVKNEYFSTDDGTLGMKGNVIDLLGVHFKSARNRKVKIFGCGPHPMLKALQKFCAEKNINCEISVESNMACGFGICQGCPVHSANEDKYYLICKDGPVFKSEKITL